MAGQIGKKVRRILALCMTLAAVLVLFSGCSRRATSGRRTSTRSRTSRSDRVSSGEQTIVQPQPPVIETIAVPEQTDTAETEPLVYVDTRIPNYPASAPRWETLRFEWTCHDGVGLVWMDLTLDAEMYSYYRNLERYFGVENLYRYVNDENNCAVIRNVVSALREVAKDLSYDDAAVAREIAKFVQDCIEYQYDADTTGHDEYPRYPIETIYERQGDCEDTSILMAALLKEWGYEVGFLHLPGHIAVALRTSDDYSMGSYYEIDGHRYLFIESTGSGWNIGDIPEEYMEISAEFYLIP